MGHLVPALVPVVLAAALGSSSAQAAGLGLQRIGRGYHEPVYVTNAGDSRLFVVELGGKVKIVGGGTFLDISKVVDHGRDQGLLGLAFHPDFARNGRFYVFYNARGSRRLVLAEYRVSGGNSNHADPSSQRIVLAIPAGTSNHNGGWLAFKGPYLFVSVGDGETGGDPHNRAQSLGSLRGKILRIDPLDPDGSGPKNYSIPQSNPFVGRRARGEIWAYGLRNPWRCSFDLNGDLWCGDVGEDAFEEIDRASTGYATNFGWHLLQGFHFYKDPAHAPGSVCTSNCKTLPIAEYAHSVKGSPNCAVMGGYVARRSNAPLYGDYIFGDLCSGRVWVIPSGFQRGDRLPTPYLTGLRIVSFGEGNDGRIYVVDKFGSIYRLTST